MYVVFSSRVPRYQLSRTHSYKNQIVKKRQRQLSENCSGSQRVKEWNEDAIACDEISDEDNCVEKPKRNDKRQGSC